VLAGEFGGPLVEQFLPVFGPSGRGRGPRRRAGVARARTKAESRSGSGAAKRAASSGARRRSFPAGQGSGGAAPAVGVGFMPRPSGGWSLASKVSPNPPPWLGRERPVFRVIFLGCRRQSSRAAVRSSSTPAGKPAKVRRSGAAGRGRATGRASCSARHCPKTVATGQWFEGRAVPPQRSGGVGGVRREGGEAVEPPWIRGISVEKMDLPEGPIPWQR
jgi:hypothetical protein